MSSPYVIGFHMCVLFWCCKQVFINAFVNIFLCYTQLDIFFKDPRTKDWLFVPPGQAQLLSLGYILLVWLGPKIMQSRKAFNLQREMIVYNFFLVVLSLYMCVEVRKFADRIK